MITRSVKKHVQYHCVIPCWLCLSHHKKFELSPSFAAMRTYSRDFHLVSGFQLHVPSLFALFMSVLLLAPLLSPKKQ